MNDLDELHTAAAEGDSAEQTLFARNLERQRALYGEELREKIRRLQAALDVSQARLAKSLGISTAMISQLMSGRRVKIGDPNVLARLLLLDRQVSRGVAGDRVRADALLAHVRESRPNLGVPTVAPDPSEALRGVASQTQLAAAANVLGPRFPAIAEMLRRAAADRR
ncbi:MAG: XRE family transcriptional regulator [Actinomycetota bacterium]|nr:XRE family transcriptional regulator [Actinomycetota bacterium]